MQKTKHLFQFCSLTLNHWSSSRLAKQINSLRKGWDLHCKDCASSWWRVERHHLCDTRQVNRLITRTLFKNRFCIFTSAQALHLPSHLPGAVQWLTCGTDAVFGTLRGSHQLLQPEVVAGQVSSKPPWFLQREKGEFPSLGAPSALFFLHICPTLLHTKRFLAYLLAVQNWH